MGFYQGVELFYQGVEIFYILRGRGKRESWEFMGRRASQPGGRHCKHKQIRRPGTGAVTGRVSQMGVGGPRPAVGT